MSGVFRYVAFNNAWSVDLGNQAVRLAQVSGFTELAELGAVGSSDIILDDPTGTAGHSSDGIIALQQFFYDDTRAATQRVYAGWTGQRQYVRGDTARGSLITGVARQIQVHLEDANTLAGRLHFAPASVDATVKRPAETAAARITWLLGTAYLPGVGDHGNVNPASVQLDPNDYSDQTPADLLNHCSVATGDNWFIYWDRTANAYGLAVFNMTTYNGYKGTLQLSNDISLIDSSVTAGAGATDTWAVQPNALLTRDPSHYCDRVSLPYAKGTAYVTGTSTKFPDVTHSAPSTSVKTSALAVSQANRFLSDNSEETDRITCSAKIAAANVNDALAGQLIKASFTHFPSYTSLSTFRIARRTVSQVEPTDQFYLVEYELVPAAIPATTCGIYTLTPSGTHYPLGSLTGDNPPNGSDGVTLYGKPGIANPVPLTVGTVGAWNFPQYGGGGVGTIDYAGDRTENALMFTIVGNGTIAVKTELYTLLRILSGTVFRWSSLSNNWDSGTGVGSVNSGDTMTVTVTDRTGPNDCIWQLRITDTGGTGPGDKWGWSSAVYTKA